MAHAFLDMVKPVAVGQAREHGLRRLGLPGAPEDQRLPEAAGWGQYPGGATIETGAPLFPRIKA